ncbi:MAG TPA: nitroreductase family protein [Mycobacteriales bacterium]|nr:nitroreductase family protein [Mycobacteriales bacterium]
MDTGITDELLSTTRAVRRKLDLTRPVEPEVLNRCLELAIQAPTPSNTQAWRWLVVRDQQIKNELGRLYRDVGEAYLRRSGDRGGRLLASAKYLVEVIEQVPVFVIPCLQGRPPQGNAGMSGFYGGIFPAVWSFQLALRSRGLGSTLTTFHLQHEAEAARILGIPDDVTQVGLLPVAYTTVIEFRPARRTPIEEISYLDTWGNPLT